MSVLAQTAALPHAGGGKLLHTRQNKMRKKQMSAKTVLELAYERIEQAFKLFDTVEVSFSGGKDSTICLNLTIEVARRLGRLPVRVFFYDEEAIPYQTEDYVRRVGARDDVLLEWYCLPVKHRNACSREHPWWSPWDPADAEKWVRPLPPEGITWVPGFPMPPHPRDRLTMPESVGLIHDPRTWGRVGMVMGIRGQESIIRTRSVSWRTYEQENYIVPWREGTCVGNVYKVYPIYDWQTDDVWTAPALFKWDYNRAYDVMEAAGVPPHHQRCSPAYGEEPMHGFHLYKVCFPEIWDEMSHRVPGANTALYYARSDVYGYGNYLTKPDDVSWPQFLDFYIQKFPPPERAMIADNIKQAITMHYANTADPLVGEVDHPITGISWRRLLNLALRGDLKGRRRVALNTDGSESRHLSEEATQKRWDRYREARLQEGL